MSWQLQEAKQRLSELIERALSDGPQVVTRRGEAVVVVMSVEEFRRLQSPRSDFKSFLLNAPALDVLELERLPELPREVEV